MSLSLPIPNGTQTTGNTVEISVKGKWITVPALSVEGKNIIVKGKWVKKAIVEAEEWLETDIQDPELCVRRLKEQESAALRADIFTFIQKLPATSPKYGYPMERHSIAAARITTFKEWWDKLPQETRKNVRRSQKRDVVVEVKSLDDELIRGIVEVNNDSPVRQKIRFAHYGKTFEQVKKDQSSFVDRSDFICAYLESELIGFMKVVYRGQVASILQMLPRASHYDKRPANALVAKAIELCEAKRISYLTYGMFNYGNKRDSSLRDFKIRNGFEEVLVPRFYIPLTIWGSFCVKLKLHRGLLGVLPHSVIAAALRVRTTWYDFKRGISRCSSMSERSNSDRQMGCSNPPAGSNFNPSAIPPPAEPMANQSHSVHSEPK
jgi:hypothetical protein